MKDEKKSRTSDSLALDFADDAAQIVKIRVIGVGGAGGNAINRMVQDKLNGVDFVAINTDLQTLEQNHAPTRVQIGKKLTKGLGAGGNPEIGKKAIEENKDAVIEILSETDMVFIACGMGGGTGTGAAPVVAEIARDLGALTVGIVTTPFLFEGNKRMEKAENGIAELKENVDTLIVVPNQKLISLVPKNYPLEEAFRVADEILFHATKGISDVINVPGLVNVDFADVRTVMSQMGDALMGSGVSSGENRAREAAEQAISSPLIDDVSILGALGVLVNITGGKDLSLNDITEATTVIHQAAGDDANIIFGAVKDLSLNGDLRVTVIATGFHRDGIRSGLYRQKTRKVSYQSNEHRMNREPTCSEFDKDILEQVMGEVIGHDGNMSFESKNDLSIPTFIRKQMD
jgi:cell division protein FtsZ